MKWLVKRLSTAASMMVSVIHVAEQETLCRRGFWCNQNLSLTSAHCCIWSPAPAKSLSLSLSLSFLQMSPELKYGRFQLAWLFLSLALNAVCFDLRRWLGNNMHTLCSSKQCALTLFFFYIFSLIFSHYWGCYLAAYNLKSAVVEHKDKETIQQK